PGRTERAISACLLSRTSEEAHRAKLAVRISVDARAVPHGGGEGDDEQGHPLPVAARPARALGAAERSLSGEPNERERQRAQGDDDRRDRDAGRRRTAGSFLLTGSARLRGEAKVGAR